MTSDDLNRSLTVLLRELTYGAPLDAAFVLNRGDAGLLASLDALSAADASQSRDGGASIAAHVDHLRYGLSLMNRWAAGENPFTDADWSRSWEIGAVSEREWNRLRDRLRDEVERWLVALESPRQVTGIELDGVVASVIHLGYHLGAIRQIHPSARGPKAND